MKNLLFVASMLAFSVAANSQLVFNINQSGSSFKDRTGRYENAELKDANLTITMQNQEVRMKGNENTSYRLTKIDEEKKVNQFTYSQIGHGLDANNNAVTFKFTVNTKSKDAVVELANNGAKNYYFGTCNYGEKLSKL